MPQVEYIEQVVENHPQKQSFFRRSLYSLAQFSFRLTSLILYFFKSTSDKNPYADEHGRPKKGYREKFYQHELKKDRKRLASLSAEQRNQTEEARQSLYKRMQS